MFWTVKWYFYHFLHFISFPLLFAILIYPPFYHMYIFLIIFASLSFPLYFYSIVSFHFIHFSLFLCLSFYNDHWFQDCHSILFYVSTLYIESLFYCLLTLFSLFFIYDHQMISPKIFLLYFISYIWFEQNWFVNTNIYIYCKHWCWN